jgi:membrane dipeptidase
MKVVDMHCDTISAIFNQKEEGKVCGLKENHLHIDIEKMKKGNYLLQNFAMFVDIAQKDHPWEYCLGLIDLFYDELALNQDEIALALNYGDILENQEAGKISALLTIEEGGITGGRIRRLQELYAHGARMLTLTWNYENGIGFPNFDYKIGEIPNFKLPNVEKGLTEFGLEFIHEMEALGMIIDVSSPPE